MKNKDCIKAVLTPPQLDKFCKIFDISPEDIEVNFDGWSKHVLLVKDKVFVFPRNPKFTKRVRKELDVYEEFTLLNSVPLPKLLKRVKDPEISYYEFGAITRLGGIVFSKLQNNIQLEEVEKFLINLSGVISIWHNIPRVELPKLLEKPKTLHKQASIKNWHEIALDPQKTEAAVSFIFDLIEANAKKMKINSFLLPRDKSIAKWTETIKEIANLDDVLIHGDIHEDQILVDSPESMNICGVLDWATAKIDNPVWDFNFGEWGLKIWDWSEHFISLRRKMWREYLRQRKLSLSTNEGLHLFFTLWEFTWLVKQKKKEKIVITKHNYRDSVSEYIDRLEEVTKLI